MNPKLLSELQNPLLRQEIELALASDSPKHLDRAFPWSLTDEGEAYWSAACKAKTLSADARAKLLSLLKTSAPKPLRGFANMDPERQRAIATAGGKAVPKEKRSFSLNPSLAAAAGAKGGKAVRGSKRTFSKDPELAAEAGRKGGKAARFPKGLKWKDEL